jgi:signal transduction histidine kinase/HAMP domain-containing protein
MRKPFICRGWPTVTPSIRQCILGGFLLLVVIIAASTVFSILMLREIEGDFLALRRQSAVSTLGEDIARRTAALRQEARDYSLDHAVPADRVIALADAIERQVEQARATLPPEPAGMLEGIGQHLAAFRSGFQRIVFLQQERQELTQALEQAADELPKPVQAVTEDAHRTGAAGLMAAAIRLGVSALNVLDRLHLAAPAPHRDPTTDADAFATLQGDLAALSTLAGESGRITASEALQQLIPKLRDLRQSLTAIEEETAHLDAKVLGTEGKLIVAATDSLRESVSRAENDIAGELSQTIRSITRSSVLFGVAATILGAFCASLVVRRFVRPLSELTGALIALPRGGDAVSVPYRSQRDEIGEIARAVESYRSTMTELDEKRRQLHFALDNITQGLVFLDADLRVILANRRYREIFGFSAEFPGPGVHLRELLQRMVEVGNFTPEIGQQVLEERLEIQNGHEPRQYMRHLCDGRTVELAVQPLPGGGSVATFSDVTERERTAAALLAAKNAAETASSAKSLFLAKMSHELRTPLNAIIGFSEIIRDRAFGESAIARYADYAADINFSGRHLLNVINDVLDMAKIESGELVVSDDVVDLKTEIRRVLPMLRQMARAASVELIADVPDHLPALRADERLVLQLLLNLLSNAIKFTPDGGTVTIAAQYGMSSELTLSVTDTGIGMEPEQLERIFEPFFQVDSGHTRRFEGTGLGLTICKSIIERHGGSIRVESTPGRGTRVSVLFPKTRVVGNVDASGGRSKVVASVA